MPAIPKAGRLRAARGLTLWDVASGRVERDLQQWTPLTQWIDT